MIPVFGNHVSHKLAFPVHDLTSLGPYKIPFQLDLVALMLFTHERMRYALLESMVLSAILYLLVSDIVFHETTVELTAYDHVAMIVGVDAVQDKPFRLYQLAQV